MKTINVKPVESVKIQLKDKEYTCTFNMLAMSYLQEALADFGGKTLADISPARMTSMLLYCGIRANNEDITTEEANALAMQMGPANYGYIINLFNASMNDSMNEEDRKTVKKLMAQTLSTALKSTSK